MCDARRRLAQRFRGNLVCIVAFCGLHQRVTRLGLYRLRLYPWYLAAGVRKMLLPAEVGADAGAGCAKKLARPLASPVLSGACALRTPPCARRILVAVGSTSSSTSSTTSLLSHGIFRPGDAPPEAPRATLGRCSDSALCRCEEEVPARAKESARWLCADGSGAVDLIGRVDL